MALTKVKASNIILTTPSASSNDVTPATTEYVTTALANLVDSAPSTLNTLNELAAALGDDANFSTTVTNSIAAKAPLASPVFTGNAQVSGNNHLGIGGNDFNTTAGTNTLTVGTVGSTTGGIQLFSGTSGEHWINWGDTNSSTGRYMGRIGYNHSDNDLMFYSSGTQKMVIDSNGNIGIGESSPDTLLHIKGSAPVFTMESSTNSTRELGILQQKE